MSPKMTLAPREEESKVLKKSRGAFLARNCLAVQILESPEGRDNVLSK